MNRSIRRARPLLALFFAGPLVLTAAPRTAHAEASASDRAAAQTLFDDALTLMDAGKISPAVCGKLEESQKLDPGIGTLLNLGICFETIGRTASSFGIFGQAAVMARNAGDKVRQQDAERRAKAVEAKLSRIVIRVAPEKRPAGLEVRRDGQPVREALFESAIPVDPGEHEVQASAPGKKSWTASVRVPATPGNVTVDVPVLADAPAGEGTAPAGWWSTQRKIGVAVAGVGVAGVVLGSVFGATAAGKKSDGVAHCGPADPDACDATGVALRADALTAAHVSTVGFVVGGAALATGVVLVVLGRPKEPPKSGRLPRVTAMPVLGAGMTGLVAQGEF